jgi:hypothetical protein
VKNIYRANSLIRVGQDPTSALARFFDKGFRQAPYLKGGLIQVQFLLRIEPEIGGNIESRNQFYGHLWRELRLFVHDPVNDLEITVNMMGKLLLRDSQGDEEFLPQDFPWRGWFAFYWDL